ncbi:TIGR03118 family protein [Segetibacter koreensis]|uniref:TIGR03118 family protein n=1 Tax=Segetibacter koreensis TaxID=398037 RepID=UPI000360AFCE|nr:TIGR03118 family protein [Segetibacter koreensis]
MKKITKTIQTFCHLAVLLLLFSVLVLPIACKKHFDQQVLKEFRQVNLVGNNNEYGAPHIDPALLNSWGLAFNPTGIAWVSAQTGHVSTIYDKLGNTLRKPVNIPSPEGPKGGNPTGIVFNNSDGKFFLSDKQKATFLFAGIDGVLSGWNPTAGDNALLIKNNSATSAYTGLAIGKSNGTDYLYAANFKTRKIDVWNGSFSSVSMSFNDPDLPSGYAPFNIQNIEDKLYVAYAKVASDGDEEPGSGNGFVDIFNTNGSFVKRFASKATLNAPWGLAKAPASFFADTDDSGLENLLENGHKDHTQPAILVGNFGDGRINAFDLNGKFLGQLKTENKVMTIDKLWAISFPPSTATSIDPNRLYFTAGPDDEADGLFGYIVKQ